MNTQLMSAPERIVYNWLIRRNITFTFQSSMSGGRFELGGAVVDFTLDDLGIAIRVQGSYWHKGVKKEATDSIQRELLESQGWTIVDVWESDLDTPEKIENTLSRALRGEEVL